MKKPEAPWRPYTAPGMSRLAAARLLGESPAEIRETPYRPRAVSLKRKNKEYCYAYC